jgi:hypothetical protein
LFAILWGGWWTGTASFRRSSRCLSCFTVDDVALLTDMEAVQLITDVPAQLYGLEEQYSVFAMP